MEYGYKNSIRKLADLADHDADFNIQDELKTMVELEQEYIEFTKRAKDVKYDFSSWLPALGYKLRPMVPGEVCVILAATGCGKTIALHNLAMNTKLKTILFEIELPASLTFERFVSQERRAPGYVIERTYEEGKKIEWKREAMDHIFTCSRSRLDIRQMEKIINEAHKKIGSQPALILIDYIGLIGGVGNSRYERMSYIAEEIKKVARATNTVIIMASQIARKEDGKNEEVFLSDGKDSGSIEQSAGIVLGMWKDNGKIKIKICKQTKGGYMNDIITCDFHGETSLITQAHGLE